MGIALVLAVGCPTEDTVLDPIDDDDMGDDDTTAGDDDTDTPDDDSADDDTAPADADGDGWTVEDGDCDDSDATVHPEAEDVLCDGIDSDCSPDAELYVPDQYTAIQDAIDTAQEGDTVCVAPGTYVEQLDYDGKAIRVMGIVGAEFTIVDGGGVGPVVTFDDGEPPEAVLEGVTIMGGSAENGGGILLDNLSAPTLTNLVVRENEASSDGGGIYAGGGSNLTLSSSVVSENRCEVSGGGVRVEETTAEISGVTFHSNEAMSGGGASFQHSTVNVYDSLFEANAAQTAGGFCANSVADAPVTMVDVAVLWNVAREEVNGMGGNAGGAQIVAPFTGTNLLFAYNHADDTEGGADIDWEPLHLTNVAFIDNTAMHKAGLSLCSQGGELNNLLVAGNWASNHHGGLFLDTPDGDGLALTNVAIIGNRATECAGMARSAYGPTTLRNVVVAFNRGTYNDHGTCELADDGLIDWSYSVFWDNSTDEMRDIDFAVGADGNDLVDPLFGYASFYGWYNDLHLDPASPLIDAGDPTILDPDGSRSDIGIYGGPAAGGWDQDFDGFFEWWQPGDYDSTDYPALGWDCDDRDEDLYPDSGC